MNNNFIITLLSVFLLAGCGQFASNASTDTAAIDAMIAEGDFAKATESIKTKLATDSLSPKEAYDLNFKIDRMNRIRQDFSKDDTTVLAYIKKVYPGVTDNEMREWENSNALENMTIDGVKKYFRSAPRNLFRINRDAQKHWQEVNGRQSDEVDTFLAGYIPEVIAEAKANAPSHNAGISPYNRFVKPVTMKIKYTLTVDPGEIPAGEIIRVWMPYPRNEEKYKNIELLSTSQPEYTISPDSYQHKSIYMEKIASATEAAVFSYELKFTSYNQIFLFSPEDVKPYDTESELYKKFTSERETHVIFSDDIKRLTDSIVGNEQNPYLKAKKIFCYIADNYPWASAREYSTIENIPQYVVDNHHGDCGQVSLLFITMARYAGIPAKWQSGWMLHPKGVNLHDWAGAYFEGIGWVPVDQSFGYVNSSDPDTHFFFTRGLDAYRYIVNDDYSGNLYPAKTHPRSETVDFQRGEVEWRGENLYFGRWHYNMEVEYEPDTQ